MSSSKRQIQSQLNQAKIESLVGAKLEQLYAGYQWTVECKFDQGVVEIKNITIHGDYGFIIYLSRLVNDPALDCVMRAGGELLERCGLPTSIRPEDLSERVTRDLRGNVEIGDKHAG